MLNYRSVGVAVSLLLLVTVAGCNNADQGSAEAPAAPLAEVPAATPPPPAAAPRQPAPDAASTAVGGDEAGTEVAALETKLQGLGCFACHTVDEKRIGPSYREVAAKYRDQAGAADALTAKVLAGGGGVWGPVPMIAHPHLKAEQIKPLVLEILQLR